ncbi:MAG TPA: hypothetical protein PLI65_09830 [Bacteroidales bacterium]|nr:hypothetical protein [Bacteroidales bacterium]HPR58279.1 hypothetical protein [Bacteroidales bacterium]
MGKSVFPKKFSASVEEHYKILNEIFAGVDISSGLRWFNGYVGPVIICY